MTSAERQFARLPRELLESDAWQGQGINCRRLVDFLMIEHMRRGGRWNGLLKAPRRQLCSSGVGSHFISDTIDEAEWLGLIDVHRGSRRIASTYALTWLPLHDGTEASNRWRDCAAAAEIAACRKKAKTRQDDPILSAKQHSSLGAKQHSKPPLLSAKQHSKGPESLRPCGLIRLR